MNKPIMHGNMCFCILILFLLLTSCSDDVENFNVLSTPKLSYKETYQLKKSNVNLSIEVPKENRSLSYYFVQLLNDSLLYCRTFERPNEVHLYDIKNKIFLRKIFLDIGLKNIDLSKIGSFAITKNQDIILNRNGIFYIFNNFGKLKRAINCSDITYKDSVSNDNIPMTAVPFSIYFASEPVAIDSTKLLISFQTPESFNIKGHDYYRAGIVDLKTKRCIKYLAKPNDNVYALMKNSAYNPDLTMSYKLLKGDTLIISYPMDHYVYGYNIKSGKEIFKKLACSKNVKALPSPLPKSDYLDRKTKWDFRISTPFYEPLYYHSKLKMYTRIIHYPQAVTLADGKLNNGEKRTSSVIILDSSLNIVGETKFANSFLGIYKSFPTSDGLVFGSQNQAEKTNSKLIYNNYYIIDKI